jgi:hypothetical protein
MPAFSNIKPDFDWNVFQILWWILHRDPAPIDPPLSEVEEAHANFAGPLEELNNAAQFNEIELRGRRSPSIKKPRTPPPLERIPGDLIDEHRKVDASGWLRIGLADQISAEWLHDQGPFFYDVRGHRSDVMKRWRPSNKAKPPVPPLFLLRWWLEEYVPMYPNPEERPTRHKQLAAAEARFPNNSRPTVKSMQGLRKDPRTPPGWTDPGRRPKSS